MKRDLGLVAVRSGFRAAAMSFELCEALNTMPKSYRARSNGSVDDVPFFWGIECGILDVKACDSQRTGIVLAI